MAILVLQLDIKIGKIISAQKVEGADKLLKLMVDVGGAEYVQILSGIAEYYPALLLVGKEVPIIVNLEPRTLKGHVSNGMMLAAVVDETPVLLHPDKEVPLGSIVR